MKRLLLFLVATVVMTGAGFTIRKVMSEAQAAESPKRNVIFILSDDHRYDFMSFIGKPTFLETPNLDRLAQGGMHFRNAFVSTALCSPSRATILTGQYAHRHGVVDNQRDVPPDTKFFPEFMQDAGYKTAFIGKWHMGYDNDSPRSGFDHWISFKGQGTYFDPILNVNGVRTQYQSVSTASPVQDNCFDQELY